MANKHASSLDNLDELLKEHTAEKNKAAEAELMGADTTHNGVDVWDDDNVADNTDDDDAELWEDDSDACDDKSIDLDDYTNADENFTNDDDYEPDIDGDIVFSSDSEKEDNEAMNGDDDDIAPPHKTNIGSPQPSTTKKRRSRDIDSCVSSSSLSDATVLPASRVVRTNMPDVTKAESTPTGSGLAEREYGIAPAEKWRLWMGYTRTSWSAVERGVNGRDITTDECERLSQLKQTPKEFVKMVQSLRISGSSKTAIINGYKAYVYMNDQRRIIAQALNGYLEAVQGRGEDILSLAANEIVITNTRHTTDCKTCALTGASTQLRSMTIGDGDNAPTFTVSTSALMVCHALSVIMNAEAYLRILVESKSTYSIDIRCERLSAYIHTAQRICIDNFAID